MSQPFTARSTDISIGLNSLSTLMPMARLERERLLELSKHIRVKSLPAGTTLFERGDDNQTVYYLITGDIDLKVKTMSIIFCAGSPQAKQPIDPHHPRQFTAVTRTPVEIIEIERELLDIFVARDKRNLYHASKAKRRSLSGDHDMDTILQSKIFQMIPPVNIQVLLNKFEEVKMQRGQIIFRQNAKGDYYYLIKSGSCAVLKYDNPQDGWRIVAELEPGYGFGEEALLSDKPRNASVIVSSDGTLLRLAREDFDQLIKTPVVKTVSYDNALQLVASGAIVVNIQEVDEEASDALFAESLNIPMSRLRASLDEIPGQHPLLVYSNNEHRSACAAYILIAHGFEVLAVKK